MVSSLKSYFRKMDKNIKKSDLENELTSILARDVSDLPIYKDLPRLAPRISVESSFIPIPPSPQVKVATTVEDSDQGTYIWVFDRKEKYCKSFELDFLFVLKKRC